MRGSTCIRRLERLPARFSMRPVDGQGVRPQELGPISLAKRAGSDLFPSPRTSPCLFWYTSG